MVTANGRKRSLIPVQVKWEEVGTKVEGFLMHKETTMYRDQPRGRYLIRTSDGLRVVLGTFQIDQAMNLVEPGDFIGMEYRGEEGTNSGNRFKLFDIWVDDDPAHTGFEEQSVAEAEADELKAELDAKAPAKK